MACEHTAEFVTWADGLDMELGDLECQARELGLDLRATQEGGSLCKKAEGCLV